MRAPAMTGGLFTTPEERDALAGEYVFGTLDAATAARVTAALPADAALREAVAEWEARLTPLSPEPPDRQARAGWDRMEAGRPRITVRPARPRRPWVGLWRAWAVGASAIAAVLGLALFIPGTPVTVSQAVLVADRAQAAWIARVDHDGALHLTRFAAPDAASADAPGRDVIGQDGAAPAPPTPPEDRVLQAWMLSAGDGAANLGVLPRGATRVTLVRPSVPLAPGMRIGLSLEPPGGSPTGRPTGPVVFTGRLVGGEGG